MSDKKLKPGERKLIELIILYNNTMSQKELATEIDVTERTIQNYLGNPLVKDKVNEYYDERLWKLRPIAYKGFEYNLRKQERWAIELFFKLNGEMIDRVESKNETNVTVDLADGMTDDNVNLIANGVLGEGGECHEWRSR